MLKHVGFGLKVANVAQANVLLSTAACGRAIFKAKAYVWRRSCVAADCEKKAATERTLDDRPVGAHSLTAIETARSAFDEALQEALGRSEMLLRDQGGTHEELESYMAELLADCAVKRET